MQTKIVKIEVTAMFNFVNKKDIVEALGYSRFRALRYLIYESTDPADNELKELLRSLKLTSKILPICIAEKIIKFDDAQYFLNYAGKTPENPIVIKLRKNRILKTKFFQALGINSSSFYEFHRQKYTTQAEKDCVDDFANSKSYQLSPSAIQKVMNTLAPNLHYALV